MSVWCYECQAYLTNGDLTKLICQFERSKFGSDENGTVHQNTTNKCQQRSKRHKCENKVQQLNKVVEPNVSEDNQSDFNDDESRSIEDIKEESTCFQNDSQDGECHEEQDGCSRRNMMHPYLPRSMEDLAKFIKSNECKSILILAGAGMSRASGSK